MLCVRAHCRLAAAFFESLLRGPMGDATSYTRTFTVTVANGFSTSSLLLESRGTAVQRAPCRPFLSKAVKISCCAPPSSLRPFAPSSVPSSSEKLRRIAYPHQSSEMGKEMSEEGGGKLYGRPFVSCHEHFICRPPCALTVSVLSALTIYPSFM